MTFHRGAWRRFRPARVKRVVSARLRGETTLWRQARARVDELFPGRQIRDDALARAIQSARDKAIASNDMTDWCTAMILQAPRAASAQEQMDEHPHGYHNKEVRLFELIDFNDTYVSAVLSAPESELATFADEAKIAMDTFCKRLRSRCFSNEQFEAITHGLSREIAVYRGAIREGYQARMTSRVEDAFGIDMVITDPDTDYSINIDCKSSSAFYYRLKDLARAGRLTPEQAELAEERGYCTVVNGDARREAQIVLLRVDEQTYGRIRGFSLTSTAALGAKIKNIIISFSEQRS